MPIKEFENKEPGWITIRDQARISVILYALGDGDKKKILIALANEPNTISNVLDSCGIAQTSGYRKFNVLINDGLITAKGFCVVGDKRVKTYVPMFEDLKIRFENNKIIVSVKPNETVGEVQQQAKKLDDVERLDAN